MLAVTTYTDTMEGPPTPMAKTLADIASVTPREHAMSALNDSTRPSAAPTSTGWYFPYSGPVEPKSCERWAIVHHKVSTSAPCFHVLRKEVTIAPLFRPRRDSERRATAFWCFCVYCMRK